MYLVEGELWDYKTKTIHPYVFSAGMKVTIMPDVHVLDTKFVEKLAKEYNSVEIVTWIVDDTHTLDNILMSKHRMSVISNAPARLLSHMNKFYKNYCQDQSNMGDETTFNK